MQPTSRSIHMSESSSDIGGGFPPKTKFQIRSPRALTKRPNPNPFSLPLQIPVSQSFQFPTPPSPD